MTPLRPIGSPKLNLPGPSPDVRRLTTPRPDGPAFLCGCWLLVSSCVVSRFAGASWVWGARLPQQATSWGAICVRRSIT